MSFALIIERQANSRRTATARLVLQGAARIIEHLLPFRYFTWYVYTVPNFQPSNHIGFWHI